MHCLIIMTIIIKIPFLITYTHTNSYRANDKASFG